MREFHRINYFSIEDRYEEPVTDLPSTTTPITTGGMAKNVSTATALSQKS
jgi:hypothetical protein